MAYSAQGQSLFGQVGAPNAPRPGFDGPGTVNAIGELAASLIHQAYLRKQQKQQIQMQQSALQRQEDQDQVRNNQWEQEHSLRRDEFEQRKRADERKALTEGITPGTEGGATATIAPSSGAISAPAPSGIQAAMTAGLTAGRPNAASPLTSAVPDYRAQLPSVSYGEEAPTAESFDPTKSAAFVRSTETAHIRAEAAQDIEQQRESSRAALQEQRLAYVRETGKQLATLHAKLNAGPGGTGIGKAMTANVREKAATDAAFGLIEQANGSYDDAEKLLNSDAGKSWRDFGIEPRHLMAARGKYTQGATKAMLGMQSGALGASPTEAFDAFKKTRDLVTNSGKPAAPAAPAATAPAATAAPAAPTKQLTAPAKTTASVPAAADDFTDADMDAAIDAGKRTPDDVRAFITEKRAAEKRAKKGKP